MLGVAPGRQRVIVIALVAALVGACPPSVGQVEGDLFAVDELNAIERFPGTDVYLRPSESFRSELAAACRKIGIQLGAGSGTDWPQDSLLIAHNRRNLLARINGDSVPADTRIFLDSVRGARHSFDKAVDGLVVSP